MSTLTRGGAPQSWALTQNIPSFSSLCVIDPTHLEQQISNGTLTVTLNSQQEICVLSKAGGVPLPADDIMKVSGNDSSTEVSLATVLTPVHA